MSLPIPDIELSRFHLRHRLPMSLVVFQRLSPGLAIVSFISKWVISKWVSHKAVNRKSPHSNPPLSPNRLPDRRPARQPANTAYQSALLHAVALVLSKRACCVS